MATYNSFEDLPVWQDARNLASHIYKATRSRALANDHGLRTQMQRAAISVPSNIAEGFERHSQQEFIQFLYIAKGSCAELRSQLHIARDLGYIDQPTYSTLSESAANVSKQIAGLIDYLKSVKAKAREQKR